MMPKHTNWVSVGRRWPHRAARGSAGAIELTDSIIRDEMVTTLRKRKGVLDPAQLFDAKRPRLAYQGARPLTCAEVS